MDSGSTDGTIGTPAKNSGADRRPVQLEWKISEKRSIGRSKNIPWKNEWVLILDADERITPELAAEIREEMKSPRADGYFINRRFIFLGKWI